MIAIIIMQKHAARQAVAATERQIRNMGHETRVVECAERTVIRLRGGEGGTPCRGRLEVLPGVEQVIPVLETPGRIHHGRPGERLCVGVGEHVIFGGTRIPVMAGIHGAEGRGDLARAAEALQASGVAGLWVDDCPGHDEPFRLLTDVAARSGLPVCLEIAGDELVEWQAERADMLCVDECNMQNVDLLQVVGRQTKPVLLKRRATGTTGEWLVSAEYIMEQGNTSIMLYESDGRLFEAAELRRETRLPVVVAPCSTGRHIGVIEDTALAAIAGGADGVMLELDPDSSGSSPGCVQALTLERVGVLMEKMRRVAEAVGREL